VKFSQQLLKQVAFLQPVHFGRSADLTFSGELDESNKTWSRSDIFGSRMRFMSVDALAQHGLRAQT